MTSAKRSCQDVLGNVSLPGVSLAANQEDETDTETFQMEIDKETRKCTFRSSQGNYWALVAHGGIQSTATEVWVKSLSGSHLCVCVRVRARCLCQLNHYAPFYNVSCDVMIIFTIIVVAAVVINIIINAVVVFHIHYYSLGWKSFSFLFPWPANVGLQAPYFHWSGSATRWRSKPIMGNTSAPRRTGSCWRSVIPQVWARRGCSPPLRPCPSLKPLPFCSDLAVSGDHELLALKLVNRPTLILRGEHGFICHHRNSNTLDANRSIYDVFILQFSNGAYHIQGRLICALFGFFESNLFPHISIESLQQVDCVTCDLCRSGWSVLVRERCWAGVFWWRGAGELLSWAARTRPPCHPWQKWKISAWRSRRHIKGRWTLSEQLSSLGILKVFKVCIWTDSYY